MRISRQLNPVGVDERRRRTLHRRQYLSLGPNYCWHIDGYDKLKPYGFPIHGCVDGYSRKILWLEVLASNNNPLVIADLYLRCIRQLSILPARLRTDLGTENGTVAAIQSYLRRNDADPFSGTAAHVYGTSHSNQRIEAWWSQLRKSLTSYFITFFRDLVDLGYNAEDPLQKACAWYCFSPILKRDLNDFKHLWNTHNIRFSTASIVSGRPKILYELPGPNAYNQGFAFNMPEYMQMRNYVNSFQGNDDEFDIYYQYFDFIMQQRNMEAPDNLDDAKSVFQILTGIAYAP